MEDGRLSPKKIKELHYIEEARRASSLFPIGKLVPSEKPDFLLHRDSGKLGIEVTELCEEEPRAEGGRLGKVAGKAQQHYSRIANTEELDVSAAFVPHPETVSTRKLANGLADFVHTHQREKGSFDWHDCELPEGYCYIAIHKPLKTTGCWSIPIGSRTSVAPRELIDSCLRKKLKLLPVYRTAAPEVWLLIVNDQFLGAGEVYARPDYLAKWCFPFDFDKVLLFSREIGGNGEVIELQKAI
jgi:hypothetical protein